MRASLDPKHRSLGNADADLQAFGPRRLAGERADIRFGRGPADLDELLAEPDMLA